MAAIPHAVLSERFQDIMKGRRLRSAVFLTYRFAPGFFEQQVLPAVLSDAPFSTDVKLRLAFLEGRLAEEVNHMAVYYDQGGLVTNTGSAKLDVRRIPISLQHGCFHPKNVMLLVESKDSGAADGVAQSLIVATMSANLTKSGWWENVEVCHIEEVAHGGICSFRDDLLSLIRRVREVSPPSADHAALDDIRVFVRALSQRQQRTSHGSVHTRLYSGGTSVSDFLSSVAGAELQRLCLEVISPYFNAHDVKPLGDLNSAFAPREIRVYLPRAEDGSAQCSAEVYESARKVVDAKWGTLPAELLKAGKNEQAKRRAVHAKVYRFFHPARRYEAFFVGSVNLTTAAHAHGQNFETAVFLEGNPRNVPEWWLSTDTKKPTEFLGNDEDEDGILPSSPLAVRYDWHKGKGHVLWGASVPSGTLSVSAQGVPVCELSRLSPGVWQELSAADATRLREILGSTSFLTVSEDGEAAATVLVQEDGMSEKPSLLKSLSVSEILESWALLTVEQKTAFLEAHFSLQLEALGLGDGDRQPLGSVQHSIFDTFAGIFHSFLNLERVILEALEQKRPKEAEYKLLGRKFDSLPSLLDRLLANEVANEPGAEAEEPGDEPLDLASRYVIVLCAKQLVRQVEQAAPGFCEKHRGRLRDLNRQIASGEKLRQEFTFGSDDTRGAFIDWFERRFLERAESLVEVPT